MYTKALDLDLVEIENLINHRFQLGQSSDNILAILLTSDKLQENVRHAI